MVDYEYSRGSWAVRCPFTGERNASLEHLPRPNMLRLTSPHIPGALLITDSAWVIVNHVYGHPPFRQTLKNWYNQQTRRPEEDLPKIDLATLWAEFSDDIRDMQGARATEGRWDQSTWGEGRWGNGSSASIDRERVRQVLAHHGKLVQAAKDRTTPPELLHDLIQNNEIRVCAAAAANPTISDPDLRQLMRNSAASVRSGAAKNPKLPRDCLTELARDSVAVVRASVAGNRTVDPTTLGELAFDPAASVRTAVGRNRATPISLLGELFRDPASSVRAAVASNRSTPVEVLEELARDPDPAVRAAVAGNPSTPDHVHMQLVEDQEPTVQSATSSRFRPVRVWDGPVRIRPKRSSEPETVDEIVVPSDGMAPAGLTGAAPPVGEASEQQTTGEPGTSLGSSRSRRLSVELSYRRTIVTEIRVRGYPTVCLRVATVPRLRPTDAPISLNGLVEALDWALVPEEQTPEVAARDALRHVIGRLEEVARTAGAENDEAIAELVRECLEQPCLLIHQNPHVPNSMRWVCDQAVAFVECPEKPARAVLIIGRAVILITIGLYVAQGVGAGFSSIAESAGDAVGERLARWILDPSEENGEIEKIERYFEKEVIDESLVDGPDQMDV